MYEDGGSGKGIQRRLQTGAAAWMKINGIIWDRKKQLNGKVVGSLRGSEARRQKEDGT